MLRGDLTSRRPRATRKEEPSSSDIQTLLRRRVVSVLLDATALPRELMPSFTAFAALPSPVWHTLWLGEVGWAGLGWLRLGWAGQS